MTPTFSNGQSLRTCRGGSKLPFVGDDQSLLVRTWFVGAADWDNTKRILARAFTAELDGSELEDTLTIVDDRAFEGWSPEQFVEHRMAGKMSGDYLFLADEQAQTGDDVSLLVLNLELQDPDDDEEPPSTGRTFRVPARSTFSVHANLSLANMFFDELADSIEQGGPP